MQTTWIIQTDCGSYQHHQNINNLIDSCAKLDINYKICKIKPKSTILPMELLDIPEPLVIYGLDTLVNLANNSNLKSGIFYNPITFKYSSFLEHYGDLMLNSDALCCKYKDFLKMKYLPDTELHIRLDMDAKDIPSKIRKVKDFEYSDYDTTFVFSTPKKIEKEWRYFIVDKKIISKCQYKPNIRMCDNIDADEVVLKAIDKWVPADIFVMDIAYTQNNEYRIVECNAFNWSSFYCCDISAIVRNISMFLEN